MTRGRVPSLIAIGIVVGLCPAQTSPQAQLPIFRGGTNLVLVDAYPRKDGHIVEGLTPRDFEVLEDGKPQAIDQFEFVRIEPAPEVPRIDPNNQRDMLQQAADPHNRVFVTYLDIYHTSVAGSHDIRRPLVEMINRIVAPNDLFGVTTSKVNPRSLVLGRRMQSVEDQLARYWPWGERKRVFTDPDDPKEDFLTRCNKDPEYLARRREESTLANLRELIEYVGAFREARTSVIVITDGWRRFRPDQNLHPKGLPEPLPPVGVTSGGQVIVAPGLSEYYAERACASELGRLAALDDDRTFRDIIALANRTNVVFYPVNPAGLEVFDSDLGGRREGGSADAQRPPVDRQLPVRPDPFQTSALTEDMDRHKARVESAQILAANTDGIAVVNTNDLRGGLAKIVSDTSAFYLLGYYSTNAKTDGSYRQIKVRVRQDKVDVASRRGYVAAAAASASRTPAATGGVPPADVRESLGALARIGTSDLFTYSVVSGANLVVVAEIASGLVELGKWRDGGTVSAVVTGPAGAPVGTATGAIEAGARGVLLRVPHGTGAGPWKVGISVTGRDGALDDRLDVRSVAHALLGDPVLYRATGVARAGGLRPVADFLYRRTERVHVEWPIVKPLDGRGARVLDRRGLPMPLAATLTERDENGQAMLAADLTLAQFSPGDFVLEVSATSGAETQTRQVAFRVVR